MKKNARCLRGFEVLPAARILSILLIAVGGPAWSATYHVPSASHPSLALLVGALASGDSVIVADGEHAEGFRNVDFGTLDDITLVSASGDPLNCTIDTGDWPAFLFSGSGNVIDGFTFRNGSGRSATYLIESDEFLTVRRCRFERLTRVWVLGGRANLEQCEFVDVHWREVTSEFVRGARFVGSSGIAIAGIAETEIASIEDCSFEGGSLVARFASVARCSLTQGSGLRLTDGSISDTTIRGSELDAGCTVTGNVTIDRLHVLDSLWGSGLKGNDVDTLLVSRSLFANNNTADGDYGGLGPTGGMSIVFSGARSGVVRIDGTVIAGNLGFDGGFAVSGMRSDRDKLEITDTVIYGNRGVYSAGGLRVPVDRDIRLERVLIAENTSVHGDAGGILVTREGGPREPVDSLSVVQTNVVFSTGEGLVCDDTLPLRGRITCTNIFGSSGGDWVDDCVFHLNGFDGNHAVDPQLHVPATIDENTTVEDFVLGYQKPTCAREFQREPGVAPEYVRGGGEGRMRADATSLVFPEGGGMGLRVVPNPTFAGASVRFSGTGSGPVSLTIHDITGRRVRTLVQDAQREVGGDVQWDGTSADGRIVTSGVYFVRLETGGGSLTKKLIVRR